MAVVFSVFNQKGGVGKTSLVVNMACVLARYHNAKVLVIDSDIQCNTSEYLLANTSEYMDVDVNQKHGWLDLILGRELQLYPANIITRGNSKPKYVGIDVFAASKFKFGEHKENDMDNMRLEQEEIEQMVAALKDIIKDYDYVICDLPPHFNVVSKVSLMLTNQVVVPILPDSVSLDGYNDLLDTITTMRNQGQNVDVKIGGIVLNRCTSHALSSYLRDALPEEYGELIVPYPLRAAEVISKALWFQRPLIYFKPTSNLAKDYEQVVDYLINQK